ASLWLNGGTIDAVNRPVTLPNRVSIDGDVTFGGSESLTFSGQATLSGNRALNVSNTTTFGGFVSSGTGGFFTETIGDNGVGFGLTKRGPGTLVLSGDNTYSGETVLDEGTLVDGSDTAFGTGTLVLNGGTLQDDGGQRSISNPTILGGDVVLA